MKDSTDTYLQIIRGCKCGESKSQAAFYDMFVMRIYTTAYRMLDSVDEAEDVAQEVLLRVLTHTDLLVDTADGMQRRVVRMAVNECIDRLRRRKIVWEVWDEHTEDSDEAEVEEILLREEREDILSRAIAALPHRSRTVLQLAILEEMGCDEIASLLGITESSVRVYLARAKRRLIELCGYDARKR